MGVTSETNGVLEACRELDVVCVACFPLASGRLAGPPAAAKPDKLDAVRVALAVVAPGATKTHLGAPEWHMTDEAFTMVDAAAAPAK